MSTAERAQLYSPQLLSLATELAQFPLSDDFLIRGSARSQTCGSTLEMGLDVDVNGLITRLGMRAKSCAVGQSAAAIFALAAKGTGQDQIVSARDAIAAWCAGRSELPLWPGFEALAPARDYPARHAALLLPWNAAIDALSKAKASS